MLKEGVWQDQDGQVVKYSLAYVNPAICGAGRKRVIEPRAAKYRLVATI